MVETTAQPILTEILFKLKIPKFILGFRVPMHEEGKKQATKAKITHHGRENDEIIKPLSERVGKRFIPEGASGLTS